VESVHRREGGKRRAAFPVDDLLEGFGKERLTGAGWARDAEQESLSRRVDLREQFLRQTAL
jgi:hypothetical protein